MKFSKIYTLKEILDIIGNPKATFIGDANHQITGINEIHSVEAGDISFVDHPKYYTKSLNSAATTIIINKDVECPQGKALIISDDPFRDYVRIVKHFCQFTPATAMVSPSAKIGKNTVIQPGAFVGNNVTIGDNCIIHANATIYDDAVIGNNVIIHSNSVIGADAYYFKKRPEKWDKLESCGGVYIADNVEIGALCAIDRGVSGITTIDEGTKLDNHVQVGHDTYVGKHCLIGSHCAIAGCTRVEDECLIWAKSAINKDLVVGKGAVVLATSAVDKSIEGNGKVYFGLPAEDVNKKWREMAAIRSLPTLLREVAELKHEIEQLKNNK